MKFRKKPVVVEAVQLRWDTWGEVSALVKDSNRKALGCYVDEKGNRTEDSNGRIGLVIPTLEGEMLAREGDWIIRGVAGEIYPCKPDIFAATYEPAE